jgi:signal transduction histidine kinase
VGLGGMRERARELGGLLSVKSLLPEPGTFVSAEIPIMGPANQTSEMTSSQTAEY